MTSSKHDGNVGSTPTGVNHLLGHHLSTLRYIRNFHVVDKLRLSPHNHVHVPLFEIIILCSGPRTSHI